MSSSCGTPGSAIRRSRRRPASSQCVEIETHLAECGHCRDERDTIAGLRDRTTALLATLSPRALILPPPFELLAERRSLAAMRAEWQRRIRQAGLWAAGIAAAVGAGWGARTVLDPHRNQPPAPMTPLAAVAPLTVEPDKDILETAKPIPIPPLSRPAPASMSSATRIRSFGRRSSDATASCW